MKKVSILPLVAISLVLFIGIFNSFKKEMSYPSEGYSSSKFAVFFYKAMTSGNISDNPDKPVTFSNVRVLCLGTKFMSFAHHGEPNGERIRVWNISSFLPIIEQAMKSKQEVDLTMIPEGAGWKILSIKLVKPLPPMPWIHKNHMDRESISIRKYGFH